MKFINYFTYRLLCVGLLVSLFAACSKDDDKDEVTPEQKVEVKEITIGSSKAGQDIIKVPEGLAKSDDPMAQTCISYITTANSLKSYLTGLKPPANAEIVTKKSSQGDVLYKWSASDYNGNSAVWWLSYTETKEKLFYVYELETNDIPKFKFLEIETIPDGSWGKMNIYLDGYLGSSDYNYVCTWSTDSKGVFNYIMDFAYAGQSAAYDIIVNPDGSGDVDFRLNGASYYFLKWDAIGNGTWTITDIATGSTMTGSWDAGK